ncbi:MAG: tRNA uridine-5-carboxymethylaminomethyl(34) synthesis GTPase MnmE [Syntrophorhabdaceae bacterium]
METIEATSVEGPGEMPAENADTICAVSTPPGEGGISIIRISGPDSRSILNAVFRPKNKARKKPIHGMLRLGYIVDPMTSRELDEVFAVYLASPGTYTREDMVEIQSHGGLATQKSIMETVLSLGARLAQPGEFTKRAFLNGRIDLVQAESVLDIIKSETDEELNYAVTYLKGTLSKKINSFRDAVKESLAAIEASIDFPEEDIEIDFSRYGKLLQKARRSIDGLVESYYDGKGIKTGFEVLIAGSTNVGKSSLLNALASRERAIVTELPGTTRDLIEETIYVKGIKIHLIDTAGIRVPENIVEEEGIRRVMMKAGEVDLILWVLDNSRPFSDEDHRVFDVIHQYNKIVIINKSDIATHFDDKALSSLGIVSFLKVCAKDGTGLEEIRSHLITTLTRNRRRKSLLVTTIRHRDILAKVSSNISTVIEGLETRVDYPEILAFELREALHHLGEITGETCTEDILDEIFSKFCIGK